MRWGRIALWVFALLPSVTIALLSLLGLFSPMSRDSSSDILTLICAGTLLVSTAGTISTIWLVWPQEGRESRKERGESQEDTLRDTLRTHQEALKIHTQKIQQLEMQLAELRAKTSFTPPVAP